MKLNLKGVAQIVEQKQSDIPKRNEKSHILVVDDEESNVNMLSKHLLPYYKVTTFTSAAEALRLIDSCDPAGNFSVVVSDQIMPGMTGVEFLTELKKRQVLATRILLTGFSALDTVVSAVNDAAIFRYVTKPVNIEKFFEIISEADDQYQMKKENGRLIALVKDLMEKNANYEKQLPANGSVIPHSESEIWSPRRHELVVMFVDIRGFTQAARKAEPEQIFQILDRVFTPLNEIIYEAGGVIDKYLGDGLMAVFGLSGTSQIQTAVKATTQMAHRASEILRLLPEPFADLKLSFGLAAGEVAVGMMGRSTRSEYAVIGDVANLAARLQEATKMALASEEGRQALGAFDRVMSICCMNIAEITDAYRKVTLPPRLQIRDFPDMRSIGVYTIPGA
jgi:class 3 adenylate cyclase/FixJ family two-component response regulator